jgi:hypothetical protein
MADRMIAGFAKKFIASPDISMGLSGPMTGAYSAVRF